MLKDDCGIEELREAYEAYYKENAALRSALLEAKEEMKRAVEWERKVALDSYGRLLREYDEVISELKRLRGENNA